VGGEEVISLLGYDLDGDKTSATVTSLPSSGRLYHLSYVFNKHGYEPKKGKPILTVPTQITSTQSRVLYLRPPSPTDREILQNWDRFQYTVAEVDDDGTIKKKQSQKGTVTLIGPSHVIMGSDFRSDDEGWTVHTADNVNNRIQHVTYEPSSKGLEMNRYIYSGDRSINVDSNGYDLDLWMFAAPSKFTGWHGIGYGGTFEFVLSYFGGEFTPDNYNKGKVKFVDKGEEELHMVEIHCQKCRLDTGVTIAYPLSKTTGFDGNTKKFAIVMTETSGWLKDPENTLLKWTPPTKCEFIEILSGISSIKIMGDFTKWYESVSLDNVVWRSAPDVRGRKQLPPCAQNKPDGRKCTC